MITRIHIRNFKSIKEASIDFSDHLVFVGPNNSGKTTAIQALAVWRLALSKWLEKRTKAGSKAKERPGVPLTAWLQSWEKMKSIVKWLRNLTGLLGSCPRNLHERTSFFISRQHRRLGT